MNDMTFGLCLSHGWRDDLPDAAPNDQWAYVLAQADLAEASGFSSIWLMDHLQPVTNPAGGLFECWSTLSALAVATSRVRLGQIVTCNGYRPPALLAKMASMVDAISNGRLDFGIGAGWFEREFVGWGYEYPRPGVRLEMLAESVRLIRALWSGAPVDHDGKHYQVTGVTMSPPPVQEPHPPVWIGARGERTALRIVAEHADMWNMVGSVDEFVHKRSVLRRHCDEVGRDLDTIGTSVKLDVVIGSTERVVDEQLSAIQQFWTGRGASMYADLDRYRQDHLVGTPEQIVERIGKYREAGCEALICDFFGPAESVELFASTVIGA